MLCMLGHCFAEILPQQRTKRMRQFLRATAGTAIARLSHRNSVCLSVSPSVCHTGGSGKNGAS